MEKRSSAGLSLTLPERLFGRQRRNDDCVWNELMSHVLAAVLVGVVLAAQPARAVTDAPPEVPPEHVSGMEGFQSKCAKCHGEWAKGTEQGPPLLHPYYLEGHHADSAFYRAVLQGSPQPHWDFGDMPPVEGATTEDAKRITDFVRWLQKERGVL